MNLSNFEGYIEEKILARGFDYYNNGTVISITKFDDNLYKGEVQGTELYTVEVEQKLFAKYLNRPAFKDELSKVK